MFRVGDTCALEFPDHSFDRVLSLLVLHFVPRADQAIAEMRRVARPGGVVGATVWDTRGGFVANRIFFDTAAVLDPRANERRARNYTRPMTRPGELANAWLSAAERARLRDAVRLAYVDGEPDGPRSYAAVAWAVKGIAPG